MIDVIVSPRLASPRQQYLYFDNYIDFGTYEVTDVHVDRLHGWFEHQKLL